MLPLELFNTDGLLAELLKLVAIGFVALGVVALFMFGSFGKMAKIIGVLACALLVLVIIGFSQIDPADAGGSIVSLLFDFDTTE